MNKIGLVLLSFFVVGGGVALSRAHSSPAITGEFYRTYTREIPLTTALIFSALAGVVWWTKKKPKPEQ